MLHASAPWKPEEIASATVLLASDESSYITGIDLPVDGGFVAARVGFRGIRHKQTKSSIAASKIGAVFYIIWACLHLLATYSVYVLWSAIGFDKLGFSFR